MKINNIETPALIIDLDILENNQNKIMSIVKEIGVELRPHYKSHKSTFLAHKQIAMGAKGITCAKLSEAEDLILSGIEDVLIANQVVEQSKIMRLAYLAGCCRLTICVDDPQNILMLEAAAGHFGNVIYCLVEYEVGMNRCGVSSKEKALELAKLIKEQKHLRFEGIQAYAGHLSHEENDVIRAEESEKCESRLRELLDYFAENNMEVKEVSGSSTGTVELRKKDTVYTEIQAGTYLFMDAAYDRVGVGFEHSLFMLASVISTDKERIVCDAGMKSLGVDQGNPVFADFTDEDVEMSEEHSAIYCEHSLKTEEKIQLIPGHCCTTMNLHNQVYLVRGDKVIDRIFVDSRGKSL